MNEANTKHTFLRHFRIKTRSGTSKRVQRLTLRLQLAAPRVQLLPVILRQLRAERVECDVVERRSASNCSGAFGKFVRKIGYNEYNNNIKQRRSDSQRTLHHRSLLAPKVVVLCCKKMNLLRACETSKAVIMLEIDETKTDEFRKDEFDVSHDY